VIETIRLSPLRIATRKVKGRTLVREKLRSVKMEVHGGPRRTSASGTSTGIPQPVAGRAPTYNLDSTIRKIAVVPKLPTSVMALSRFSFKSAAVGA
jgi:hypothetical protein